MTHPHLFPLFAEFAEIVGLEGYGTVIPFQEIPVPDAHLLAVFEVVQQFPVLIFDDHFYITVPYDFISIRGRILYLQIEVLFPIGSPFETEQHFHVCRAKRIAVERILDVSKDGGVRNNLNTESAVAVIVDVPIGDIGAGTIRL